MSLAVAAQKTKFSSMKGFWERVGYSELIEIEDDENLWRSKYGISMVEGYDFDCEPILEKAIEYLKSKK
jgi:hypothetical protein